MKRMIVKVESFDEMMQWGDELAMQAEQGKIITESCIRSFEEPEDLLALFTPVRRQVLSQVQMHPATIDELAARLQRCAIEVEHDIAALVEAGVLVIMQGKVHPVAEEVVFETLPQMAALP